MLIPHRGAFSEGRRGRAGVHLEGGKPAIRFLADCNGHHRPGPAQGFPHPDPADFRQTDLAFGQGHRITPVGRGIGVVDTFPAEAGKADLPGLPVGTPNLNRPPGIPDRVLGRQLRMCPAPRIPFGLDLVAQGLRSLSDNHCLRARPALNSATAQI